MLLASALLLVSGCRQNHREATPESPAAATVPLPPAIPQDTLAHAGGAVPSTLADIRPPDVKVRVRRGNALVLETEGLLLTAADTAVTRSATYSATALYEGEFPGLPQGMVNMTAAAAAYRLLPSGDHFRPAAELRVAYDPDRLPMGYTPDDIYTSFYDIAAQAWVRLDRIAVDTANREIVSLTSHFTDFINELLKAPEMPETQAFVPTQMSGLEAANPLAAYTTIAPPVANNMGTANISYPFQIPVGRGNVQPSLALTYSSNGGNGVCGMGWDLQLPCISVETRWGVPLYDSVYETETYLLNGEHLLVSHDSLPTFARRYDLRDASPTKRFYPRIEGAFDSILRHGISPQTYWWEVFDRQGTCYVYGRDCGELRSQREKAVAKWYLTSVTDRNGNTARYHYSNRTVSSGASTPSGTAVFLDKVSYSAPSGGVWYGYGVTFHYNSRPDPIISGNYGVKENIHGRLDSIKTWYAKYEASNFIDSSLIRGYRLLYSHSATGKSLLSAIVEMSPEEWKVSAPVITDSGLTGTDLKYHRFRYRKHPTNGAFAQQSVTFYTNIESAKSGMPHLEASPLGGSKSSNASVSFSAGVGLGARSSIRTFNVEGNGSFSPLGGSEGRTALVDINGDGYPDLLYKTEEAWECQLFSPQTGAFRPASAIHLFLPTYGFSKSTTMSDYAGWEYEDGTGAGVNVGAQYTYSSSENTMYFSDVNADGKTDIVKNGKVWFNNSHNDTIAFSREFTPRRHPDQPCESSYFAIDRGVGLDGSIYEEGNQFSTYVSWIEGDKEHPGRDTSRWVYAENTSHNPDSLRRSVVRVWIAPEAGSIQITGSAKLDNRFDTARQRTAADGVHVSIQHNGTIIPGTGHDLTKQNPMHDMSVTSESVQAGDRIYFRVEALKNDLYDVVDWSPTVTYRNKNQFLNDAAGRPKYSYNAKNDFLAWKEERFCMPQNGRVRVSANYSYNGSLQSQVITLKMFKADTGGNNPVLLDSRRLLEAYSLTESLLQGTWDTVLSLDTSQIIYFTAESSSMVDWTKLRWFPHITSLSFDNGDSAEFTVMDESGAGQMRRKAIDVYISPSIPMMTLSNPPNTSMDVSVFGNINRRWGHFVYNCDTMRTPIDESRIVRNAMYQDTGMISTALDGISSDYGQPVSVDDVLSGLGERLPNPDRDDASPLEAMYEPGRMNNRILMGFAGKCYITPTQMSLYNWHSVQATLADSTLLVPVTNQSIAASGQKAVGPVKGSYQHGFSVHASLGLTIGSDVDINGCFNYSNGKNCLAADFVDFNGDGYPDAISETAAQYTNPWGGLSSKTAGITPLGKKGVQNTVYHAYSIQGGSSYPYYKKNGKSRGTTHAQPRKSSVSGNTNVAKSYDHAELVWMDVNGDGLPDCIDDEGHVAISLGYGFDYASQQELPAYASSANTSDCKNISANLGDGFAYEHSNRTMVNQSFSAGSSGTRSVNTGTRQFTDMNGDGLVDMIHNGNTLYYNTGWGFSTRPITLTISAKSEDISYSYGFSGNITLGVATGIFKAQGSAGLSSTLSASTTETLLLDMNGDGLPDKVSRAPGGAISVNYNQLYDVDKLVAVESFYGNRMTVSYAQAPYSSKARQRPTVMAHLVVSDTSNLSSDKRDFRFEYKDYVHSVNERTPYGFDSVIIIQYLDNTPYRITRQHYRTDLYKMRGRKASERITDARGRPYVEYRWHHELKLIENGTVVPPGMAHCHGATWPAPDSVAIRHYNPHSGSVEIETLEKYTHADSGRVVEYANYNNLATTNDDVRCTITYSRSGRNQAAQVLEMAVMNHDGVRLRKRTAEYDSSGRMTGITVFSDESGLASTTNYTYDTYGNILTVLLPPNGNGERTRFEYTYDTLLHMYPTRTVDAAFGDTSRTEYDLRLGLPLRIYSKGGDSISYTYDSWGRPRTIRAPQEHDTNGVPTICYRYWDDQGGVAPQFNRNRFRSFTGTRVSEGRLPAAECTHNSEWPLWAQTMHRSQMDPQLKITTVLFTDGHGRVLQTRKTAVIDGIVQQVASGEVHYDDAGRPEVSHEPFVSNESYCQYATPSREGVTTSTEYDVLDRVVRTTVSHENIVTENHYGFYNMGGVPCFWTETLDPEGRSSVVLTAARGLTLNSIDALQGDTRFEYDALGQHRYTHDPENFSTGYGYDMSGRLRYRTHPDAGTTRYTYDPAGNLIEEDNPLGQIFYDYTYYRVIQKRYSGMSYNDIAYEYGTNGPATGRPVRITDGSGVLTLEYDALGNVSGSERVLGVPSMGYAFAFTHTFLHDSWGRMLRMTYPDGEQVEYHYNRAGNMTGMTGDKDGHTHRYINDIGYNKYGQRTHVDHGNGSYTKYSYDPLQRLDNLTCMDGSGSLMQNISYTFDRVNNITTLHNAASDIGGLGGVYTNTYSYDELNRLVEAHGTGTAGRQPCEFQMGGMRYSASGRLGLKHQNWNSATTGGTQRLEYGYPGNAPDDKPHAPRLVEDIDAGRIYGLEWDPAGNLIQVSVQGDDPAFQSRFLYWTEDNRLHTVADDRSYSYYAYDHTGQRTLKMAGNASLIDQNAWYQSVFVGLNRVTMYPSAYLVLSEHGYTKHYYAGAERVAARIGGGNLNHDTECIVEDGEAIERSNNLFWQCSDMVNSAVIEHRDLEEMNIVNIDNDEMEAMWKFDMKQVPSMMKAEVIPEPWKILDAIGYFSQPNSFVNQGDDDEPDVYFYHSDHLGSANWITDATGTPVQHLQYLPYGEPYINQRVSGYSERFTFTGKERDEETGYSYFGARYMDHELMTMWLSVDPMSDKYPSISPYAYCAWNPVKLVDPDGKDPIYGKILGTVKKIGDDGKNDGKVYYVTGEKKYSVLWATLWGYDYTSSLEVSENVFHVPTGNIANDVQVTISKVKQSGDCEHCIESQVEYGAHSLIGSDHAEIWDPGTFMESGRINEKYTYKRWSITPFMQNDEPMTIDYTNVEFVWHVQPDNSIPSKRDKDAVFDYTYNRGMGKATWFVVGARDGRVSFLSGRGRCHTIDMKDFIKMSQQE